MSEFFSFAKFLVATFALLAAVVVVLIALPNSRLRHVVLTISGWAMKLLALVSIIYVLNPADLIPDGIPLAGALDDVIALAVALVSGIGGLASARAAATAKEKMIEADFQVVDEEKDETENEQ